MPSLIQVVDTAAMSRGPMPLSSSTPRTQPRASSQLWTQSKSMLPGQRGSSRWYHSRWTQPTCSPSREKTTARTLPVPASTAIKYFAMGITS